MTEVKRTEDLKQERECFLLLYRSLFRKGGGGDGGRVWGRD